MSEKPTERKGDWLPVLIWLRDWLIRKFPESRFEAPLSRLIAAILPERVVAIGDAVLGGISADEMRGALAASSQVINNSMRMPTRDEQANPAVENSPLSSTDMAYSRIAATVRQNLEQIEKNIA